MTGLRLHSAKLVAMISIQELCLGKRKIGNSWYWIVVEDMTDQKSRVRRPLGRRSELEISTRPWTIYISARRPIALRFSSDCQLMLLIMSLTPVSLR